MFEYIAQSESMEPIIFMNLFWGKFCGYFGGCMLLLDIFASV